MGTTLDASSSEARRESLFSECLKDHRGIIIKIARRFTSDRADLDDLVQEVLLRLWSSLDRYRGDAKLSTWVYRVALNRALTWQHDETKRRSGQDLRTDLSDLAAVGNAEDVERLNQLYQQIRRLREIDRAMVLLSLDGLSYAEMAGILGISESNVGARLGRARAKTLEAHCRGSAMTGDDHEHNDELSTQLNELWNRQENPMPLTMTDTSRLIDSLKTQQHKERRRLVRLNLKEVIPAVVMGVVFGGIGLTTDSGPAAFFGAAALCLSVGAFLLGSTLRQRRVESRFDATVQGELRRTLSQLRHRAGLHRTVLWWYLAPLLIAIALVFTNSRPQSASGVSAFDISYGLVALGAFGFLYRVNQKVAVDRYDPEILRYERLLDELD